MFTVNVKIWIHLRCDFDSHLNTNIKLSYDQMLTGSTFFAVFSVNAVSEASEVNISGYMGFRLTTTKEFENNKEYILWL